MNLTKRAASSLIAANCLLYLAARLWGLADSCLWFDEIFSVHAAEHTWSGMWRFVAQDLIHPPLFYALLKLWISVGGESVFWLRLLSVCFAALTLVPFVQICKELKLKAAARIWALLFVAVNGAMIKYAQEVRMYGLLLFLSTVSIWMFARFFYRGKNIWLLTLANCLLVYTHYYGWLVVASELILIAVLQRIKVRHVLVMLGIVAAAFLPWTIAVLKAAAGGSEVAQNIGWIERPTIFSLSQFVLDLVEPFYFQQSNVEVSTIYAISIPLLLIILVAKILYLSRIGERETRTAMLFLSTFVMVPIAAAVLISWLSPFSVWGGRHLSIVFGPAAIVCAIFLTGLSSRLAKIAFQTTAIGFIVAASVIYATKPAADFVWCAWNEVARTVETEKSGPTDVVVFEDLVAYHLWFASRETPRERISVLKDIAGTPEDTAYFLPRGFAEVKRLTLDELPKGDFWIAYRAKTFDPAQSPISEIGARGFEPRRSMVLDRGGQEAILVEMTRQTAAK